MKCVVVNEGAIESLLSDVSFIHQFFGVELGRQRLVGLRVSLQSLLDTAQNEDLVAAREAAATGRREESVARAKLLEAMNERAQ